MISNLLRDLVSGRPIVREDSPPAIVHAHRQTLWCALCYVGELHPDLDMPESDEAVSIIDGNASCHDHLIVLQGRTVTEALAVLMAEQRGIKP